MLAAALALAATAAARAAPPGIGINYLWWQIVPGDPWACASGEPRDNGRFFLPFYQRPSVRRAVRAQLAAMRAAGFVTVRTPVFFYRSSDPSDPHSADSFLSADGRIADADKAKLRAFVRDVAAAGFERLEVVPSFSAENWLYCRSRAWGDCFESARTDENWRFIRDAATTVLEAAGRLSVRFDLANEGAPDPSMSARTLAQSKRYLQIVAGRFSRAFAIPWTVSAARSNGSPASETANRLQLLLADLREAGLTPPFLELHTYSGDGNDVTLSLDDLDAAARAAGASEVLGELRYHSDVQAGAIAGWLRRHPAAPLIDAIAWPEYDPSTACEPLPVPPYTPGALSSVDEGIGGW